MKKENIIFLIFIVLTTIFLGSFICCNSTKTTASCVENKNDTIFVETVRVDTVKVIDHETLDSLATCLAEARDSIRLYRDSISYQDYINARRIEKIKYYISICEKKSTNKKFFYGWIKRTINE